jgi:tetratricopeptide (TPR) repeat protein
MGIRYRKSISIGGGVRLNLSKSGVGASFGVPGLRYSVSGNGRARRTMSIPGTGIYSVTSMGGGTGLASGSGSRSAERSGPSSASWSASAAALAPGSARPPVAWTPPRAGWFSGGADKRYREGARALVAGDYTAAVAAFEACLLEDPGAVSAHFLAALAGEQAAMPKDRELAHLEAVVASDVAMPDRLQLKYLPPAVVGLTVRSSITDHIAIELPFTSVGATLVLAEAYQQAGRLADAIGLVSQLHEHDIGNEVIALSLADLLFADKDYEGVVEASASGTNDSDIGVGLLHLRAAALLAKGMADGAMDAFREALAKKAGRDPELLKVVRYDRALAYQQAGQRARARADLERIYGVDPDYEDVRARLAALE